MNFWAFSLLASVLLWSLIYEPSLFLIYMGLNGIYILLAIWTGRKSLTSFRRKLQIATWNDSGDPSVFGRLEVDLTKIDSFMEQFNARNPENKITYTAIFARALGEASKASGRCTGKIAFGQFLPAAEVTLSVLVDVEGSNLGTVVLRGCDRLSISELNTALKEEVKKLKTGKNKDFNEQMNTLKYIPSFVVQLMLRIASWLCYDLGLSVPFLKVKPDNFGFGILTNVSGFGLEDCFAPLVPFCKTVVVVVMNATQLRPRVVDGKLEIRKILNLNVTFDHRFGDGADAIKMMKGVYQVLEEPEKYA